MFVSGRRMVLYSILLYTIYYILLYIIHIHIHILLYIILSFLFLSSHSPDLPSHSSLPFPPSFKVYVSALTYAHLYPILLSSSSPLLLFPIPLPFYHPFPLLLLLISIYTCRWLVILIYIQSGSHLPNI